MGQKLFSPSPTVLPLSVKNKSSEVKVINLVKIGTFLSNFFPILIKIERGVNFREKCGVNFLKFSFKI